MKPIIIKRKYKNPIIATIILIIIISITYVVFAYKKAEAPVIPEIKSEVRSVETKAESIQTITDKNKSKTELGSTYKITKDFKIIPTDTKGNKKVVLLTIDDGPSAQSADIVKTLKDANIHAIFFINGINVKSHPDALKQEYAAGNMIGNHTWDHKNLHLIKDETAKKEIDMNTDIIVKEVGVKPIFFRSPFGALTSFAKDYTEKEGMLPFNWSDAAIDWDKKTKDKKVFIHNVMKDIAPGSIILMHEHPWSRDALPDLIKEIKAKGYTFVDPKDIVK
jgi:peptidoglycan-N-acetylglucosamine deacetylase